MKGRQSGMPEETAWAGFFDPDGVLAALGLGAESEDVVEFGCGYGLFTEAAARRTAGKVYALDIDPVMVAATAARAEQAGRGNVVPEQRDFVGDGSGRPDASAGYAMLFNILHIEDPVALLREAWRVLAPGGRVAVIHWNYDPATPRGPSMDVRPRPEQVREWLAEAGFVGIRYESLECCPYHYAFEAVRSGPQSARLR